MLLLHPAAVGCFWRGFNLVELVEWSMKGVEDVENHKMRRFQDYIMVDHKKFKKVRIGCFFSTFRRKRIYCYNITKFFDNNYKSKWDNINKY